MKALIAVLMSLGLVFAAPLTWAGDGHRGGWHGGGHGHWKGRGYGHGYGHGHSYYRPYYGGYYGHHNNNGDDEVAYLLGGLLLGGLVTHAYHTSQQRAVVAPQAQYAPTPAYSGSYPQGRRLVRDGAGNCYESYFDAAGAEIRVPVSPAQCNW